MQKRGEWVSEWETRKDLCLKWDGGKNKGMRRRKWIEKMLPHYDEWYVGVKAHRKWKKLLFPRWFEFEKNVHNFRNAFNYLVNCLNKKNHL